MQKNFLFAISLTFVLVVAALVLLLNQKPQVYTPGVWTEADTAVRQAQHFYQIRKDAGEDFSSGPCLSNNLMPNWVADIAHSPRQSIDDLPENQCPNYIQGKAQHFVELDLQGNLIRVQ